ncbi:MAG: hypothetical protein CMH68_00095 [Nisaea sp.]|nr:hypothetical protein [Nisaea sp.]
MGCWPVGGQGDRRHMGAGGMRGDEQTIGVAAQPFGVAPGPGDGLAGLFGDGHQIAVAVLNPVEIDHHKTRAGADECFGGDGAVMGFARAPGAAVNE